MFAQQQRFEIYWESSQKISAGTYTIEIPSFNKENLSFSFEEGLLFVAQWKISNSINESSITLSNVVYGSISKSELKDLDVTTIPTQIIYNLKNSFARDKQYAIFQLSPIVKEANGSYKKVMSFQINYSTGTSVNRISSLNKFSNTKTVSNSVLSTGEWYRFYVDTTGVFKLTKSFLQRLGVKVNTVDPRTIKLYGNGGRMIPYSNSVAYPFDVQENAIKFVGEADGVFNNEDYILFYAQGPKEYNTESNTNINCYTDKTYYYIHVGSGSGKRIQPFSQPSGPVDLVINTFQEYKFHEIDKYNIALLGRRWFGDRFDVDNNKTFNFDFADLVTSVPINLKVYVAAASSTPTSMQLTVNGASISNLSIAGASSANLANEASYSNNVNVTASKITVGLNFDNQGNPSALGYLDYISISATRALNFNKKQFQFNNTAVTSASGIGQYTIEIGRAHV